uniref:Homing endonuclease n=1 Tax=Rhizobium phage LG08 TaxID=3129229 RepID=A0AAU8HYS9_9CAUD
MVSRERFRCEDFCVREADVITKLLTSLNTIKKRLTVNYKKIYDELVEFRRDNIPEGYKERHHIIPGSLGGSNDESNLVYLTAREHYIAHLLLLQIHKGDVKSRTKMAKAVMMMRMESFNQSRFNSKTYKWLREEFSRAQSLSQEGEKNSQFGKKWFYNPETGETVKRYGCPEGFVPGRHKKKERPGNRREESLQKKLKNGERNARKLYEEFLSSGCSSLNEFCKIKYNKSVSSLSFKFKKYIPEFKPSRGKKYTGE